MIRKILRYPLTFLALAAIIFGAAYLSVVSPEYWGRWPDTGFTFLGVWPR